MLSPSISRQNLTQSTPPVMAGLFIASPDGGCEALQLGKTTTRLGEVVSRGKRRGLVQRQDNPCLVLNWLLPPPSGRH